MTRFNITREFYIPDGAICVEDKASGACVWLYANEKREPCGVAFNKKSIKPVWRYRFRSRQEAKDHALRFFKARQQHLARVAEYRAGRNKPHNLQVGHILYSSWGYEQTNIDWYQVTKVIGKCFVEVRKIGAVIDQNGWERGTCTPRADEFIGEPARRKVSNGSVKVSSCASAYLWDGRPKSWTSYH